MLDNIKSVVAVASGKGGVGKSTVAVNLALALCSEKLSVGLLDADIYGPSIAMMLGVDGNLRPESSDGKTMSPITAHGLSTMSMAYLVEPNTPMVWRGPMASGALQQMLQHTNWGGLDVLIVDMPPGTGDIQLTLSQHVQLAGAVIVTTPQDIALLDAEKSVEMFSKVNVPILGIIENMATHTCSVCGHNETIFGSDGGGKIAKKYEIDLLGQLPLDGLVRQQGDRGIPIVASSPESDSAKSYLSIARALVSGMSKRFADRSPDIVFD